MENISQTATCQFRVLDEEVYFENALSAQVYAKKHAGKKIVRCDVDKITTRPNLKLSQAQYEKTPAGIVEVLSRDVIGQEDAKRHIATALYYHKLNYENESLADEKSAPLMFVGPTGSGKTFIVQKACDIMGLNFIHIDTSSLVSEGIVGVSLGDVAESTVEKASNNIKKAKYSVVFFDEFDKLFKKEDHDNAGNSRVSSQLLRFVEGTSVKYSYKDDEGIPATNTLDTDRMLFIFGGAFQWIYDAFKNNDTSIGFGTQEKRHLNKKLTLSDLYTADVPKEILGRINSIVQLQPLNEEDFYNILIQSESSPLREYISKITYHQSEVDIDDNTLRLIAKEAATSQLGVRALGHILEELFKEALFHAPVQKKRYILRRDAK